MRRLFSLQAGRALFGTWPRILIVCGSLVAYYVAAMWAGPFLPWWVVAGAGLLLLVALFVLGAAWLDRDVLRAASEHPETERL